MDITEVESALDLPDTSEPEIEVIAVLTRVVQQQQSKIKELERKLEAL